MASPTDAEINSAYEETVGASSVCNDPEWRHGYEVGRSIVERIAERVRAIDGIVNLGFIDYNTKCSYKMIGTGETGLIPRVFVLNLLGADVAQSTTEPRGSQPAPVDVARPTTEGAVCPHIWGGDSCMRCNRKMCELFPVPPNTEPPTGSGVGYWMQTGDGDWDEISESALSALLEAEGRRDARG